MEAHFDPAVSTRLAKHFASLHVPGKPVLVTNIWDSPTLSLVLSNPRTVAVATASYAIAAVNGLDDEELDLETNLNAIRVLRRTFLKKHPELAAKIPLSVDAQDGYGASLPTFIRAIIPLGVVGINLEDVVRSAPDSGGKTLEILISPEEAAARVRTVIETARELGVEGFVVNARSDCVKLGGTVEDAILRGRLFLEAGATTVFIWGGGARGLRDAEVKQLVEGLDGKVAVIHKRASGFLKVQEIKELGVARISMGPGLWREGMITVEKAIEETLQNYDS